MSGRAPYGPGVRDTGGPERGVSLGQGRVTLRAASGVHRRSEGVNGEMLDIKAVVGHTTKS